MQVFIITDDDTDEYHAFLNRKNAIDTMYYKCKEWGAVLWVSVNIDGMYHFVELSRLYDTDEEKLRFLYLSSETELNDIFEAYWHFHECEVKDKEENKVK